MMAVLASNTRNLLTTRNVNSIGIGTSKMTINGDSEFPTNPIDPTNRSKIRGPNYNRTIFMDV